ncbi:hypothetical protein ACRN91_00030 [Shewanella baltica]
MELEIVDELGVPEEYQDEFLSWDVDIHENNGSSGDGLYGYYW